MKILTFDIEDWFHILDNQSTKTASDWEQFPSRINEGVDRILSLLNSSNSKASFFCLGWIAEKYPEVIKRIDSMGYEIGSHTHFHQLIFEQSPREFKNDLEKSIKTIEDIIGKKVTMFRAPGFSITNESTWALDILLENGIEIDSSIFPARRAHGGLLTHQMHNPYKIESHGRILKEFPISTKSIFNKPLVFAGGGYFRLFPYMLISRWSKEAEYVMTYFHPRDFDHKQPVLPDLGMVRKFKSYYGLSSALNKLELYLKEFEFIDITEANNQIDWEKAAIVKS